MKKILLTGGRGFIGQNILEQLGGQYNFYTPSHSELDLIDANKVRQYLSCNNFDLVIHAAGAGVSRTQAGAVGLFEQNKKMFLKLAENRELFGRMIFLGSGAEYGKHLAITKVKESDFGKVVPQDEYGRAKYFASEYIASAENITNLRLFGVFGPYEDYKTRFISNAICRSLAGLPIVMRQNTFFEYVYVNDLVKIISHFINNQPSHKFFNIGTGRGMDLLSLAKIVGSATGNHQEVVIKNTGLGSEYTCDNSLLMGELGNFKFTPYEQAINDLAQWYKTNWQNIDQSRLSFDA